MGARKIRVVVVALLATVFGLTASVLGASPAHAASLPVNPPQVPVVAGNPNPGTDLFASTMAVGTGGTQRICETSQLGIPVHCVEHVNIQPSGSPTASGTTYAHWVFCRDVCGTNLLRHEMVHVAQFEQYGDAFGPMYLAEAAQHGSGCENKWEKPAYQTDGRCP
ncbi:MAG: hypothetical protein QOI61_726 [Actinomycetota bacterium]